MIFFIIIQSPEGDCPSGKYFFIIHFYAIMHRTTIVQNKIINSICPCNFFLWLIFIGLVRLGRQIQPLNFYLRRKKKHSTQNCMHYNGTAPDFQFLFLFILNKIFFKMYQKTYQNVQLYLY